MPISANDLSLRQLKYAVAVAETLGFHKAAARCHVSQPTLSAQIKQLEDVLGFSLFERDRRRVLVTSAGEKVVAHARRVLLELDDLVKASAHIAAPEAVTLRIGVIPTIAPYLLPELMPKARARFPKLQLVFREDKTGMLVKELRAGRLDAALMALEADIGKWASARVLTDHFVVALPKGHALARKKRIAAGDLDGERVLLLEEGHCFRSQALAVCRRAGAIENELRATSLATLAQMVSLGSGITLLPEMAVAVENRAQQLEIRPFVPAAPARTIAFVWRPQSPLAETVRQLAALCESSLADSVR